MAEVVALVASVVQLAGAGLALSKTLYEYADGVATADRRIKDIANEVKLTSFVIQELGTIFERDETANLISENAVRTANETIEECFAVFTELELKINKGKTGKMGRLMLPFRDNKIELLRSQIEKLKSTLELLMQVLIHAHQVSTDKYNREAEAKHREEIKQLLENKKQATKKYEESLRNLSISDGSTAVDDGERSLQDEHKARSSSDPFNAASVVGSTINPETLATCVNHVRSLLADIETLQLALAKKVDGEDHSGHYQKAIGTYFVARSHLDSVLLGNSQTNVTGKQTLHSTSRTSIPNFMFADKDSTPLGGNMSTNSSHERLRKELERERERERALAEVKMKPESFEKSAESSLYERERDVRMLVERRLRLEREAQDIRDLEEMRADRERRGVAEDLDYRPAAREDSIEEIPHDVPPDAEYKQTKYREEYAPRRYTRPVEREHWGRSEALRVQRQEVGISKFYSLDSERSDDELEVELPGRVTAWDPHVESNPESPHTESIQHRPLSQAKLAKREARARGERLWQEELRRREGVGVSAGGDESSRQRSRPLLQSSQSARDRCRSRSGSYPVEEHRPSAGKRDNEKRGAQGIEALLTGNRKPSPPPSPRSHRRRSRTPPPRISQHHRRYDSDSSGYASSIEKVGSEEETDRIKKLEEKMRRSWELKQEKECVEGERQEERDEMKRARIVAENRGMYIQLPKSFVPTRRSIHVALYDITLSKASLIGPSISDNESERTRGKEGFDAKVCTSRRRHLVSRHDYRTLS
jgi:hypothetical protein